MMDVTWHTISCDVVVDIFHRLNVLVMMDSFMWMLAKDLMIYCTYVGV